MAINDVTSIDIKTLPPFKRLIMTIGELPTSYLESMSYAELLMWFCNFLQNKVLPTINNNADALQDVINFLEDLDLQDEVNNKLDEMAESGQLQEIVAQYLNANALWCFDNVAEMKVAPNLIDGSYAKTLGYHTKNDGGMATYKIRQITNDDIVNEMDIIALNDNTLIAELIYVHPINPKCLGAYGDGTHDDYTVIQYSINKGNVKLLKGNYYVSDAINISQFRIFDGNGATLIPSEDHYAIKVIGIADDPVKQVNIRDVVIDCTTNSGNGIDLEYTYFVYLDNININYLNKNGAIGINQVNGFNDTITNSRILGNRTYSNTYGIKITTTSGGTSNMTNNKYDTLLIQRLTYGIYAKYDTTSNVNEFNNIGFSNNNYCFYIDGYTDPIKFSNIRMENTIDLNNDTGWYINGSVSSEINGLNAYNVKRVIDNHGSTDKKMLITGAISLTGTTQQDKCLFIYNSTQNIYYGASDRILSATYNFDISTSFVSPAVLINNNGFYPSTNNITSGSTTVQPNNKFIYKVTTANISNLYGRKNSECKLYTTESNLKIAGSGSSQTHQGAEITMVPNRIYNVYFTDLNKFIVED